MHGSSSQIPPQHSFPQELPPTLHHDYHVPQKHDHYLLRQQQQPHHQQQQQQQPQQQQQQQQYNIHHQPPPPFQQNPPLTTSYESACAHLTDGRRDNESSIWRSNIVDVTANRASLNLDAYASNESIGNVDNNTVYFHYILYCISTITNVMFSKVMLYITLYIRWSLLIPYRKLW